MIRACSVFLLLLLSNGCWSEDFIGSIEFISSDEIDYACQQDSMCTNPFWSRYRIKATSTVSGKVVNVIAALKSTHIHRQDIKFSLSLEPVMSESLKRQAQVEWLIIEIKKLKSRSSISCKNSNLLSQQR